MSMFLIGAISIIIAMVVIAYLKPEWWGKIVALVGAAAAAIAAYLGGGGELPL